ncbi:E3 ubiquitin-protein ligase TRIM71-like [Mytilus edulis]|uniref:E3 ubiquitin-protein ligase TRIM71-like n=1 Tax=Mytilus edulis TaxID=6550 RepID=UPI0039EEB74E
MASNPKFCGICDQLHITKPSSDWCSECNQALCTECKGFHALSKASQHHSTISISNYLALDSSFSQVKGHCSVHDDKYQLFCQSHDCLLCLTCLEEHTKCGDVVRISKLTKDVKTSESFVDTQKTMSDIICNLSKIQCHLEENVCEIKKQKESILRDIAHMRKEIDSHLDKIEKSLKIELSKVVEDQCDNTFCKTLEDIKRKKIDIEKCQLEMDDLNRYGSDLQTFFGLREISAKTSTIDQCLHTLDDDSSLNRVSISCKINTTISGFVGEVARLGTIQVQKIQNKINLERSKDKQAQLVGVRNKSINDIKLTLVNTIKLDACVSGCCFLPNGNIVICDRSYRNDGVKILNPNGDLLSKFPLPQHLALDVTCINDSNVAVSSDMNKQIYIINIDTKAINFIHTKEACHGIIHKDGSLMVCVKGKGVQNVNIQNWKNTSIVPCDLGVWSYIATSENKLYYTNNKNHSVTCCDMEGNIIWTFKDENVLQDPRGIAVDNTGNVYTVNYSQHTLIVLSVDGQHNRQLLSKENGLLNPFAVAYDKIQNRICVVNFQDKGFLFDVTI